MSKCIIICSDGTGNTAIKGRGTNVFKVFEAIDLNGHKTRPELTPQVALYDDGVGTEDFKPLKIFAGATGFGLSRNIRQLYKELVRIYDPGDRIFLFGFSRGAFTVRSLVGLITACGILDSEKLLTTDDLESAVSKAYRVYRKSYRTALAKLFLSQPDTSVIKQFREEHCRPCEVPIAFMGVWDTVDAVGLPFHISDFINMAVYRFKFRDHKLSKHVERACHALALDDERHSFHPLLWHEDDEGDAKRIEQVWFAGAHSNVGGGYPKQGMSLVALEWMMRKAEGAGLRLIGADRALYYDHANVDDKLYDPRAGLGMFYRWKVRDIARICRMHNVRPAIHLSVLERIAHGTDDYAPGNLPADANVVITATGDDGKDAAAWKRAEEVEGVLQKAHQTFHPGADSLLTRVRAEVAMGLVSYYVYLLACIVVVIAASTPDGVGAFWNPWMVIENAGLFVLNVVTLQIGGVLTSMRQLATSPWPIWFLVGGLLGFPVSYILGLSADRRMSAVFSEFWHRVQPELRVALKRARKAAREGRQGDDIKAAWTSPVHRGVEEPVLSDASYQ